MSEQVSSLAEDVSKVIAAKSSIAYLKNCVTEGSIYQNRGFVSRDSNTYTSSINKAWIRIMRLNKVGLKRYMDYQQNYNRYGRETSNYLNIFNNCFDRSNYQDQMFYMGVNIDRDMKVMGYHYNICDIYSSYVIENSNVDNMRSIRDYIYKFIFIGDKNFLIAMIDKNAIMYIDSTLLEKLKQASQEKYQEVITKLLSIYANANSIFFSINTEGVDESIINYVGKYILTRLNNESKDSSIIPVDHIDLFSDHSQVETLVAKLDDIIKDRVSKILDGTRWGINNQYSYKMLIDSILASKDNSIRKRCEKSFYQGLQLGTKFELAGWQLSNQYNQDGVSWEKEVDIVPNRFVYRRKVYSIRNNDEGFHNPYRITKLFVTGEGVMYCEGKHPNVSSGHVCMGDISGKVVMSDINELQKSLSRCEQLLYLINYDSPYPSAEMEKYRDDFLANHSDMSDFDKATDDEFVGEGDIVTDIQFEDDEPDPTQNPENLPIPNDSDSELIER